MTAVIRPIRVCYLIDELAPAGTESQLLALIRHLNRHEIEPYLCLLRGDSPVSQALEPADCPVVRLGVTSLRHPRTLRKASQFHRFLRREKIDIVQVYFPDSSYFGVPIARLAGVRTVVRTRNNVGHWLTPLHRVLGRVLNPLTTLTIANCNAAREALLTKEKPDPASVVVLENGVDLERFARIAAADFTAPRVGVVANLRPVKGLDLLVDAAQRLRPRYPELRVEIAGEGSERGPLQARIAAAGLTHHVTLCGSVADIPAFLGRQSIAVNCSHAEGMSNAVLEYMAAGRGVVATSVGANPRLIENGVHGLLCPPGDVEALCRALARLFDQPVLARQLADAGRDRVEREFSRAAMVRRFTQCYQRLAGRTLAV